VICNQTAALATADTPKEILDSFVSAHFMTPSQITPSGKNEYFPLDTGEDGAEINTPQIPLCVRKSANLQVRYHRSSQTDNLNLLQLDRAKGSIRAASATVAKYGCAIDGSRR
jgi:hypothetical protein